MKLHHVPVLLLLLLTAFSCRKDSSGPVSSARQQLNVAYGADPKQQLDLYLPAVRSVNTTKVLIMIHGGAWSDGDKADFAPYVDTLRRRFPDYAIFNLNYRLASLTGSNTFPTQENDVKAALSFIYDRRADYGISDKFVLLGASAGGHLALLQGYKYASPVRVKAIVSFFGPTDMADMYNNPASSQVSPANIAFLVGGTPTSNNALYVQSGPINFVTAQSPPTLLLQGGLDPLVRPFQATSLQAKLNTSQVVNEYVFYPNEAHGWGGANLANSFSRIQAFLNANVQ